MSPVKEKVGGGSRVTDEPEAYRSREEATDVGGEHEGRRVGIVLIVVGCVLMSLAAGEAVSATDIEGVRDVISQASGWILP